VLLTYIIVSFSIMIFVFDLFIFRRWFLLLSANSCSMCRVFAHMSRSSMKRRWLIYYRPSLSVWFSKSAFGIWFRLLP